MSKKILILDNYDSFTGNLQHLLLKIRPQYDFPIRRNHDRSVFDTRWEGLVISPGPGKPEETGILKEFFETRVLPAKMPVLGVCLGMQFLAWIYGMDVNPTDDSRHGRTVRIETSGKDLFSGLPRGFQVARYNSLAVSGISPELEITARQSGTGMIMALKHRDLPFTAVQFHPESFLTEQSKGMMENFFRSYIYD